MTTGQRLTVLEGAVEALVELNKNVVEILTGQEGRLDRMDAHLAMMDAHLAEMQRENRQTRRIWIAIARKQNLFDDEEFRDVFGDDESA